MIESRGNRYIREIRRLRRKRGDHLLLEGPHLVEEALAAGLALEIVLATPDYVESGDRELLAALDPSPLEVAPRLLDELTDADSPRGLLAVARLRREDTEIPVVESGLWLYVDALQDPGNLGAIARVAEATGVDAMILAPGSVHPNHPRALRASAGSLLRLPVAIDLSPAGLAQRLRPVDPIWAALTPSGVDLFERSPEPPAVLVVGAERGLSSELESRCELRCRIPMAPPVDSLNTAVAVAVALYEIRRSP